MDILISEGYLVPYDYPPYVDETPNEALLAKNLMGKVEFDLGELKDPISGKLVRIQGEFPRIKPIHAREEVLSEEFHHLNTKLTAWVDSFFETKKQSKYFEDLIDTSTLLTLYVNPFHQVEDEGMELVVISYFWLWHTDDFLEMAIKHNVPFNIMEKGLAQLLKVLDDEHQEFNEVEGCPGFRPLFYSLADLHTRLQKHNPGYKDVSGPFRYFLRRYFEAMKWYAVERIQGAYSEETFKFWRRLIAYFDGLAQVIMMVNHINLPEKILNSPLLRRILDICNSSGGFVNDILGLTKELKHGQVDNLIIFKVEEKGIPLKEAVAQVCELVKDEHTDYILLRDAILFKFSNDPELVKCIDVLESLLDGHCQIYSYSHRHLSANKVTLTR